ncbi:MAG TPA: flagellar hook assembly protein FlgD [Kofleriaceae bacterium]|jgi:flagellar basal-body rod modification protein FlgD|nr:flagellar hook assembly protein FlgD [Kofleriaceae bacterium]
MTVTSTTATSGVNPTAATATATSGALTGSKDEFLKLFMAQLENQDPMSPQDPSNMVAQLAQFSSVEQATETNQQLSDLIAAQNSTASASLSGLVGRTCNAGAADFQLDRGGAVPPLQITSTSAMNGASVVITDSSGKEIRRMPIPAGATSTQVAWDGNTSAGTPAAPGSYHISVDAGTTTGTITSQWHGRIDAVELAGGSTQLRMGGVLLAPGAIQTIGSPTAIPTP